MKMTNLANKYKALKERSKINQKKLLNWVRKNKKTILLASVAGIISISVIRTVVKLLNKPQSITPKENKILEELQTKIEVLDQTQIETIKEIPQIVEPKKTRTDFNFTKEEKKVLIKLLQKEKDYTKYVSGITGEPYYQVLNFRKSDPIPIKLHIIQGTVLGYPSLNIQKGADKLRTQSLLTNMQMSNSHFDKELPGVPAKPPRNLKTPKEMYSERLQPTKKAYKPSNLKKEL